jgi:hypothetical protein
MDVTLGITLQLATPPRIDVYSEKLLFRSASVCKRPLTLHSASQMAKMAGAWDPSWDPSYGPFYSSSESSSNSPPQNSNSVTTEKTAVVLNSEAQLRKVRTVLLLSLKCKLLQTSLSSVVPRGTI